MNKTIRQILTFLLAFAVLISGFALAHSGRTDSSGGHKDNKNKSGLGSYHYHCGGYPAHLHDGGVCPYDSSASDSESDWSASQSRSALVQSIQLSAQADELSIGGILRIQYSVTPENAENQELQWSVSDDNIALIAPNGVVLGVSDGTVEISASASDGGKACGKLTIRVSSSPQPYFSQIISSLPSGTVFSAKPGSLGAQLAKEYALPFDYRIPLDLPLHKGSKGTSVRDVQTALSKAGFLTDKIDGVFGSNTEKALQSYCAANFLSYDGAVNRDLYIALLEYAGA